MFVCFWHRGEVNEMMEFVDIGVVLCMLYYLRMHGCMYLVVLA